MVITRCFLCEHWPFGVNHPVMTKQRSQKLKKRFLLGQPFHTAGKPEFALGDRRPYADLRRSVYAGLGKVVDWITGRQGKRLVVYRQLPEGCRSRSAPAKFVL